MAIKQVKTISELERLEELLDSYAMAISTGATTGSATLLALSNFLKTYLQDVSKRVQKVDNSPDNYPSTAAVTEYAQTLANLVQDLTSPSATTYLSTEGVKNESDRIISIMDTKITGNSNYMIIKDSQEHNILIQYGNRSIDSPGRYTVTLPISYNNNDYSVAFMLHPVGNNSSVYPTCTVSNSSFSVRTEMSFQWLTIGSLS